MKELNIIEKIVNFLKYELPTYFCSHRRIATYIKASEILNTHCQYGACCEKCSKDFIVVVND